MNPRTLAKIGAGAVLGLVFSTPAVPSARAEATSRVEIGPDPRIELYGVVLYLGPFRGLKNAAGVIQSRVVTAFEFAYKREVDARFGRFKDHDAVRIAAEMAENGLFRLGHPPAVMLHLSAPPALEERIPIDDFLLKMAGGRKPLDTFLDAVRRFARDTDFMTFFSEHRDFYNKLAEGYRKNMAWDYIADLEGYHGMKQSAYHLILATLSHPGGFGPRIRTPEGNYEAYAVIGPKGVKDDVPEFGTGDAMRRLCWHEFSHPFVNPLTEAHLEELRGPMSALETGHLPAPIVERIKAAGMWDTHLLDQAGEYLVRGVTTRLAFLKMGAESGKAALDEEINQGFVYEEAICKALELYESRRDKYPTLKDFYPEIVAVFKSVTAY
jgi:hypothetical protein